jgi:prevent-host-death family protein
MRRASITEAKNRLSALLDRVRHGETVIIEDRGTPIAQVGPISARGAATDRERLARLERQGILRPIASVKPRRQSLPKPLRPSREVALSRLVAVERREGW